jgi:TonB-linked SusC/RagA family outer membrane protein
MKYILLGCLCVSALCASGQTNVQGKVLSFMDRQPLAGANVIIKGTTQGVITDANGTFTIAVRPSDTLSISFIGYEQEEIIITNQTELVVELSEGIGLLQEIQVFSTGYQDVPAERATGSFVQVDNNLLNRRVSTDLISRIEDVTSGVLFNRGAVTDPISIRGRSTIYANANPLIVIDNFPYDGSLDNINPNDVETITVLKDAAAASIWGARAGNGVIVITTKKGSKRQTPKVSFNSNLTIGAKPDLFYVPRMSVADYIETEKILFDQDYYQAAESSLTKDALSPVVELLIAKRDGMLSAEEADAQIEALKQYDVRNDFDKYFYQKSIKQQYAVSLSGGSDNQNYFLSAGYDKNRNNLVGDGYERFTINARNSYRLLKDKLDLTASIYYTGSKTLNNGIDPGTIRMSNSGGLYPYAHLTDTDGNSLNITHDFRNSFLDESESKGLLNWRYNPLDELKLKDKSNTLADYRISGNASYKILSSLKAEVLYQFWKSNTEGREYFSPESYYARNYVNLFTKETAGVLSYAIPKGGILDRRTGTGESHNVRGQLSFNETSDDHGISAVAGYEVKEVVSQNRSNRYYGYNDDLGSNVPVDYVTAFPQYHLPTSTVKIPYYDSQSEVTDRFVSWYFNAAYTFRDRYTLSASGRKDQSNLFGVKANQRGVPLWSMGASWIISDEGFYDVDVLPFLKIRTTYGFNGNIDKSITANTTAVIDGTSFYTGLPYMRITNPPNPELQWERIQVFNAALDFEMKNKRLSGTIEYFNKKGLDLIGFAPVAPSTGVTEYRGNTASTTGHGWDVTLNSKNIDGAFQWQTTLLFSQVMTTVDTYKAKNAAYLLIQDGNNGSYVQEGKPVFALYSYDWAGLDPANGDPRGLLEGQPSSDYATIINSATVDNIRYNGASRPTVFGAIRNTFSWKNLSLSFNISYRMGYYFRRNSVTYGTMKALGGHGDYYDRWQTTGDEQHTDVPSIPIVPSSYRDDFYRYSSVLVEKGDHIRLQDVNLTYTMNRSGIPWLPVERVQWYVYANNLGILWKSTNLVRDPDYQTAPPLRSISFGLKVDF